MNIIYRVANENDVMELRRLNDAFNGEGCNTIENIRAGVLREDAETVFVAEAESSLVGFCCGQLLKSICYSVYYTEITELYIEERLQRQGIGRKLVSFAEHWYREKGIHDFQLFTGGDNQTAQAFYESIGYRRNDDVLYRKRDQWYE